MSETQSPGDQNQNSQEQNPPSPEDQAKALAEKEREEKERKDKEKAIQKAIQAREERLTKLMADLEEKNAKLDEKSAKLDELIAANSIPQTLEALQAEPEPKASLLNQETVYLKKDDRKRFPLTKGQLNGVIVRQTKTRKIDGVDTEQPAHGYSEIGIYSQEEFDRFSAKGGLFETHKLNVEVWHKPGDTDTLAE